MASPFVLCCRRDRVDHGGRIRLRGGDGRFADVRDFAVHLLLALSAAPRRASHLVLLHHASIVTETSSH